MLEAVNAIRHTVTDPEVRAELMSGERNNSRRSDGEELTLGKLFTYFFYFGLFLTFCLIVAWIVIWSSSRGQSSHRRYDELGRLRMPALMLGVFGCGLPFIIYWLIGLQMRRIRLRPRLCPTCHTKMNRLDEVTDNRYLTAPQNTEEELNSVDYDVWLCPKCNDTIVEPYINKSSTYEVCEQCHTRAARLAANKVLRQPTTAREGQGVRIYHCKHCGNDTPKYYNIAKLPPVVIVPPWVAEAGASAEAEGASAAAASAEAPPWAEAPGAAGEPTAAPTVRPSARYGWPRQACAYSEWRSAYARVQC